MANENLGSIQRVRAATKNEQAKAKVKRALVMIEQAQGLIGEATRELCPIRGAVKQWQAAGKHYDATKKLWHKVNNTINFDKIEVE